jgi:hypothetical protein
MNNSTIAIISVALIATPAGYAVERLYHERTASVGYPAPVTVPDPSLGYQPDRVFAGEHWKRQQPRFGDTTYKPGRV